jgi:hypothetical protein
MKEIKETYRPQRTERDCKTKIKMRKRNKPTQKKFRVV